MSAFRKKAVAADGLRSSCAAFEDSHNASWVKGNRQRRVASTVAWNKRNPEKYEISRVRLSAKKLGLDPDEIEAKWREHNGLCDCCGKAPEGRRLAIEHNHATGRFRGFACLNCNTMLGHAKDDPDRLLAGVAYLRARN